MYLATVVSLAAALLTHVTAPDCDHMRGSSTSVDDNVTMIVVSDDARCLEVRANGRIEFSDYDADVRALPPGCTLRIVERRGGTTRSMVLAERGGRIEREYRVDDLRLPAAEGADWLRGIVLDLVRTTGFGAEERVARIRRQRGVGGVLDEVDQLRSDHVRRIYLTTLLAGGGLNDDELRRVARTAAQIGSDHEKAEVLLAVAGAPAAVAATAETIGSDHERARVLTALLERTSLADAATRTAFFRAADGIGSDHEHANVLRALVARDDVAESAARQLLGSAARIGSDHEKASVLLAVSTHAEWLRTPAVRAAFDSAVRSIGSDVEYRRVMRSFER
jgi:hypothetical protein